MAFPEADLVRLLRATDQFRSRKYHLMTRYYEKLKDPRSYQCYDPDKPGWVVLRILNKEF